LANSGDIIEMQRIKEIINNRPVGILLPGHSAKILEDNIHRLKDDYCWVGINRFNVAEIYILQKIDRHFDIAFAIADGFWNNSIEVCYIRRFLERLDKNLFITKSLARELTLPNQFAKQYPDKVYMANIEATWGNISLSILLRMLERAECEKVVLFGADGVSDDREKPYYKMEYQQPIDPKLRLGRQEGDTRMLNEGHKLEKMPVLNCNTKSHYEIFKKIEIGELCG
jgi:hypothetical protein